MSTGIYIHIPFCLSKCYYCDFFSKSASEEEITRYIDCLIKEIKLVLPRYSGEEFDTVFIGGGTPSILKAEQLDLIMNTLYSYVSPTDVIECSLEANPETLTCTKLKSIREVGINRLSIGIQSMSDHLLKSINRIHDRDKAIEAIEESLKAGFENINLDLIYGLPGQSVMEWKETLETVIRMNTQHISAYNLTIEKGTILEQKESNKELVIPDEDTQIEMMKIAEKILSGNGFKRYEISNYALDGYECLHNLKYWKGETFLGLGAGAHSFIRGKRFSIPGDIELYCESVDSGEVNYEYDKVKTFRQQIAEKLMMGLRLIEGVDLKDYEKRFNVKLGEYYKKELDELEKLELIDVDTERIILSEKGLLLANEVIERFF